MTRFIRRISKKLGLPPGTPVHVGERRTERVRISVIDYDTTHFQEKEVKDVSECFQFKEKPTVTWINIDGVHQIEIIEDIGKHFGIHPLVLEDIADTGQRPKMEDYGDYVYFVINMIYIENKEIKYEQVSLILGSNFVISFQEREGDIFNHVRERIRKDKGRIRKMKADYLAYVLMDAVVDGYFLILEGIGEQIEELERELIADPNPNTLQNIHGMKREIIFLRKSVWPLRELLSNLQRAESPLIQKSTGLYLRDVYDHTIQVIDTIESLRDTISGMIDIYLSSLSNKMNEVMKVLTVIATIFIPLTFIAGVYGMNFENMPELKWHWGYFMILFLMLGVCTSMLVYFKKKRWL